jgi:ribosomal protein L7/L12
MVIMGRVKTIVAGILLGIGLPISIVCTSNLFQIDAKEPAYPLNLATLIFYGIVPTTIGTGLAFSNTRRGQKDERDRLQAIFFKLLREGSGQINVLRFSMEANISGAEAKAYLDERATEFNAAYNISEEGKISYYFDGEFSPPALSPSAIAETYDVVLEYVPPRNRRDVMRTIQQLTGLDELQVKRILKGSRSSPITIVENVTKATADHFRHQLESVGASVLIVLR